MSAIQIIGGNLNTLGANGTFETGTPATWPIFSWDANVVEVTDSSTVAKGGTKSLRIRNIGGAAIGNLCTFMASATLRDFKKYLLRVPVYIPSATPFASPSAQITISSTGLAYGVLAVVSKTVAQCTNQWATIEVYIQATNQTPTVRSIGILQITGVGGVNNGLMYIDDVEVFEYIEVDSILSAIVTSVVNAAGPVMTSPPHSSFDFGSFTLFASGGVPPYTYSNNGGSTFGASASFTNLLPGTYDARVKDNVGVEFQLPIVIGLVGPRFDFSTTQTPATNATTNNASITVNPTDYNLNGTLLPYTGNPFQVSINGGAFSSQTFPYTFSSLPPNVFHTIVMRDTWGNTISKTLTTTSLDQPPQVCSLTFVNISTANASGPTSANGTIAATAFDPVSGGVYRYNLYTDFDYNTSGQATGLFTNLLPGTYDVYARSSNSCRAVVTVVVGVAGAFAVRHRIDFTHKNKKRAGFDYQFRFDIEEDGYTGAINYPVGSSSVCVPQWSGEGTENPFDAKVFPSQCTVTFSSAKDGDYIHLFSSTERKFRGMLYMNTGNGYALQWSGFLLPMLYSEPYGDGINYDVSFVFTDQLADLSKFNFQDNNGNVPTSRISIIKAISYCLSQTGLALQILDKVSITNREFPNVESAGMLDQTFIDPRTYIKNVETNETLTCREVLDRLLPGMRLYQSQGTWHIDLLSEKSAIETPFRIFNSEGNYVSSNIENSRVRLARSSYAPGASAKTWLHGASSMKIAEQYGKINVTYDLGIEQDNNLLEYGDFKSQDIVNGQILGWQVSKVNEVTNSITYGIERVENTDAFYADFANVTNGVTIQNQQVIISSTPVNVQFNYVGIVPDNYALRLKFKVYTRPIFTNTYIFIDYRLRIGNYYLQAPQNGLGFQLAGLGLLDGQWNRVYIDNHLQFTDVNILTPNYEVNAAGPLTLDIRINSNPIYDFSSITNLRASVTNTFVAKNIDFRKRVLNTIGGQSVIHFYELESSVDADSVPSNIRPNDFNSTTNPFCWRLKKTVSRPVLNTINAADWLQSCLIDNVRIEYLPKENEPVKEITIEEVINTKITPVINLELFHGDIVNPPMDNNYRHLSTSYFSKSDGTPLTGGWTRRGYDENLYFHQLISRLIKNHFSLPRWKLTGNIATDEIFIQFNRTLIEERTGKVYLPVSLSCDLANADASVEIIETLAGDPTGAPVQPPVLQRLHTDDFALQFG